VTDKLATSIGPRSDPSVDMRPEPRTNCIGCGGLHGSIGLGIHCLERNLIAARAELAELAPLKDELLAFKAMREENKNAPPSWVEKNRRGQRAGI
jgi:hypothetical protein